MVLRVANLKDTKHGIRCDRSSPLGNPFEMRNEGERELVIKAFRKYLYLVAMTWESPRVAAHNVALELGLKLSSTWKEPQQEKVMEELTRIEDTEDATLLCWCSPKPCHCDVIVNYLMYLQKEKWESENSCLISTMI